MSTEEYPFVTKTDSHSIGITIPYISSKTDSNPALVSSCESTNSGLSASLLLRNLKQGAECEEENRKKKVKGSGRSARGVDGNKELMKKGILEIDAQLSSRPPSKMLEGVTCSSTPLFADTFDSNSDSSARPISSSPLDCNTSSNTSVFDGSKLLTGVLVAGAHGNIRMLESEGSFDSYISSSSPESGYGNIPSNMKSEHSVGVCVSTPNMSVKSTSNQFVNVCGSEYTMTVNARSGDYGGPYSVRKMPYPQEVHVEVSVGQGVHVLYMFIVHMYIYKYMYMYLSHSPCFACHFSHA